MYVPDHFAGPAESELAAFLARHDFATLITPSSDGLQVTHLPLILRAAQRGAVLVGHVARANPHWRAFDGHLSSTAIFHGPHGYVSPSWYESGPAVPTWNYAVVHVTGRAIVRADEPFKREVVNELAHRYEDGRPRPWRMESLPGDFEHAMLGAIVAFELAVERVESKFKLGQNRPPADRDRVAEALDAQGDDTSRALAALMRDSG